MRLVVALNAVDTRLVDAVRAGVVLDLTEEPHSVIRARVVRDVLRGVLLDTPDPRGLRIREAQVQGELNLVDVRSSVPVEFAACEFTDPIVLDRAHLSSLDLTGCVLPSLSGWYLECDHNLDLTGVRCPDGVELAHAKVGGQLRLTDAILSKHNGPALNADGIQTGGTVFADEDFRATSFSQVGAIRFLAARIGGRLDLSGATVINAAGPAVYSDNARIDGDVVLEGALLAGSGDPATLSLIETQMAGDLRCSRAVVDNDTGPAVNADGIQIHGTAFLDDGFTAAGHGSRGLVRLPGARISGQLCLDGAQFLTDHGRLTLDLGGVRVDDELIVDSETLLRDPRFRMDCDGLQYRAVPRRARRSGLERHALRTPTTTWLALLRERTPSYTAQPYQQLAAGYRAEGHERDARHVFMAQQEDLRARGQIGGRLSRTWHRVSGLTVGYGYQPARALIGLLGTIVLSVILVFAAAAMNLTTHAKDRPTGPCTPVEHVALAADLAIPLIKTGGSQRCELVTTTTISAGFVTAGWLIQLLGWTFATLFVAGFTGIVRKQ